MRQAASISASLASSFATRRLLRMHNVGYDCGQIAAAEIGDALLLEREARPRRCGQRSRAGHRRAENHVDARKLGFGLNKLTADFLHSPRQVLKHLGLRSYGVAAEEAAACSQAGWTFTSVSSRHRASTACRTSRPSVLSTAYSARILRRPAWATVLRSR